MSTSRLPSMGSLRVGHDWATSLSLFTCMHWSGRWQPTPLFLPAESQGRGSLAGCRLRGRTELDTTDATQQQQQQDRTEAVQERRDLHRWRRTVLQTWSETCILGFSDMRWTLNHINKRDSHLNTAWWECRKPKTKRKILKPERKKITYERMTFGLTANVSTINKNKKTWHIKKTSAKG